MPHISDTLTSEGLTDTKEFRTQALVQATANSTLTTTSATEHLIIFTGSTSGQIVRLQDATTVGVGYQQRIHNNSSQTIALQNASGTALLSILSNQRVLACLQVAGTTAGTWSLEVVGATNVGSGLVIKSGSVSSGSFSGTPRTASVTFGTAFSNTNYAIIITGTDVRDWAWTSKATTGFTISSSANQALTGNVDWVAIATGESS